MEFAISIVTQFVIGFPLFIVWLVGLYLAVTRRDEHPAVYRLVIIALLIFIVSSLFGTIISTVLPITMMQRGSSATEVGTLLSIVGILQTLVSTVGWVLLLMAVFQRRANHTATMREARPDNRSTF